MVELEKSAILSDEDTEIIRELMNISSGRAAAELSEGIDVHVSLNIPVVKIMEVTGLVGYLGSEIIDYGRVNIIDQKFSGEFRGHAMMVLPSRINEALIHIFEDVDKRENGSSPAVLRPDDALIEIGNIIINAFIGEFAELLDGNVHYSPPELIASDSPEAAIQESRFDAGTVVIVLKTVFTFEKGDLNGFLFIVTGEDSIGWLKKALHEFMMQYEE